MQKKAWSLSERKNNMVLRKGASNGGGGPAAPASLLPAQPPYRIVSCQVCYGLSHPILLLFVCTLHTNTDDIRK